MHSLGYLAQLVLGHEHQCPADTVLDTAWLQAVVDPAGAERALSGDLPFLVKIYCPVGAAINAELATCTFILIDDDEAVFPLLYGAR